MRVLWSGLVLMSLLLAACAAPTVVPPSPSALPTVVPTRAPSVTPSTTATATATNLPTVTPQPTRKPIITSSALTPCQPGLPTATPAATATMPATRPPGLTPPPSLADALLTLDEALLPVGHLYLAGNFHPPFQVVATTYPAFAFCQENCVDITWHSADDVNVVTLSLSEADNATTAQRQIESFYAGLQNEPWDETYGPVDYTYSEVERAKVSAPLQNTCIVLVGIDAWLTTSINQYVLMFMVSGSPAPGASDYDRYDDIILLASVANLQIAKLKTLGLLPRVP